jgi:type IV pilus assembly protein PilA
MSSQIKAKLLQHFAGKKKANGGFTLIELLVVIIIIGILSAIALPSFLNQANKAKQSEAKTYIGSLNRAQQAYYMENNQFADDGNFGKLGLGIPQTTANYNYKIWGGAAAGAVQQTAAPKLGTAAAVRAYVGGTKVGSLNGEATTVAILCEADKSPVQAPTDTAYLPTTQVLSEGALANPANGTSALGCEGTKYLPVGK